jgi:hypothetical protein
VSRLGVFCGYCTHRNHWSIGRIPPFSVPRAPPYPGIGSSQDDLQVRARPPLHRGSRLTRVDERRPAWAALLQRERSRACHEHRTGQEHEIMQLTRRFGYKRRPANRPGRAGRLLIALPGAGTPLVVIAGPTSAATDIATGPDRPPPSSNAPADMRTPSVPLPPPMAAVTGGAVGTVERAPTPRHPPGKPKPFHRGLSPAWQSTFTGRPSPTTSPRALCPTRYSDLVSRFRPPQRSSRNDAEGRGGRG